jgi:hypothetical protein
MTKDQLLEVALRLYIAENLFEHRQHIPGAQEAVSKLRADVLGSLMGVAADGSPVAPTAAPTVVPPSALEAAFQDAVKEALLADPIPVPDHAKLRAGFLRVIRGEPKLEVEPVVDKDGKLLSVQVVQPVAVTPVVTVTPPANPLPPAPAEPSNVSKGTRSPKVEMVKPESRTFKTKQQ